MPSALGRRRPSVEQERQIYAQVVETMDYPEPSSLIHHVAETRAARVAPADLLPLWREAAASASEEAAWNMYLHVPFCKSICTFCNYKRLKVSSREALDDYVTFIEQEARLFGPALAGVEFGALYVGGGTPSVLAADQLRRLLMALHESFTFAPGAQKNFEFDPMVMTADRYEVIAELGFTRYSFGIQSVDVEVNALHNRGRQQRGHIDKQFALLEEHGAESANVDFLVGLDGTTPEGMLAEIEEVLTKHRPYEVTVYFLHPTPAYVDAHFGGDFARFQAHLAPFEALLPPALAELAPRIDYLIGGDGRHVINLSNTRRKPAPARAQSQHYHYCDVPSQVHRPLYLLGLGDSARSRIFGRLGYRAVYDSDDPDPSVPRYLASTMTLADEMFAYLAFVFRDGEELSRPLFRRTFGVDVTEALGKSLAKLHQLGVITVDDERVTFARQSRQERMRDLLFFLPPGRRRELAADLARS
ncbi:MAG: radical SAM protein, partial [Myxococcales bacterium]|nr:radical SAM protein [Myxococcales bacterium]